MARVNTAPASKPVYTHQGGRAARSSAMLELSRAVGASLLWEDTFYEKGSAHAKRVAVLCQQVPAEYLAALAVTARVDLRLRHMPLFLANQLAERRPAAPLLRDTLAWVVQRPDEAAEFLALYWQERHHPLAAQVKKGLALALRKFDTYQLGKWKGEKNRYTLRGVWKLVHDFNVNYAEDRIRIDPETGAVTRSRFRDLFEGTLPTPDTRETRLSKGQDAKQAYTELLESRKLPYTALLKNLRTMLDAGVAQANIEYALLIGAKKARTLPFEYVVAARHAPELADALSSAMLNAVEERPKLPGRTILVVDVSGSMRDTRISAKSELDRLDAAGALAALLREVCESVSVWTFASKEQAIPNYRGLALVDAIRNADNGNTYLVRSLNEIERRERVKAERLIVITDEQTHDGTRAPWTPKAYLVNVASYAPGLSTAGGWQRLTGWSERLVDWIAFEEEVAAETVAA